MKAAMPGKRIFSYLRLGVLLAMPFMLAGCESLIDSLLESDVFHGFGYFTVKAGLCIKF